MAAFPDIGLFFPLDEKKFFSKWLQLHSSTDKKHLRWHIIDTVHF